MTAITLRGGASGKSFLVASLLQIQGTLDNFEIEMLFFQMSVLLSNQMHSQFPITHLIPYRLGELIKWAEIIKAYKNVNFPKSIPSINANVSMVM